MVGYKALLGWDRTKTRKREDEMNWLDTILCCDVLEGLARLEEKSVHSCIDMAERRIQRERDKYTLLEGERK
jgi:hypothetical protein